MKTIKYRAWDGIEKKMVYDVAIINGKPFYHLPSGRIGGLIGSPDCAMMFTQLHDKNGKEIWEGDVVSAPNWGGAIHIIKYDEATFQLYDAPSNTWLPLWKAHQDNIEVIGNIFENPELLTK